MDTSTQAQDSYYPAALSQSGLFENDSKVYELHERYTPATILEPRFDAPLGRIWCKHCRGFLMIGAESVSHQNLVRASKVCMSCGQWCYLDENVEIVHLSYCASPKGEKVKLGWGGSQYRATKQPPRNASQEEAAAWPHG